MMRPELLASPEESIGVLLDLLGLAGVTVPREAAEMWTPLERCLAADWAAREHLAASDNMNRRRPKPSFVIAAEALPGDPPPEYADELRRMIRETVSSNVPEDGLTGAQIAQTLHERMHLISLRHLLTWLHADWEAGLITYNPYGEEPRWKATDKLMKLLEGVPPLPDRSDGYRVVQWPVRINHNGEVTCCKMLADATWCRAVIGEASGMRQVKSAARLIDLIAEHDMEVRHA